MNVKKYTLICLVLVLHLASNAQGIQFEKGTFNEALAKAKADNKVLFIDGYADWCGPCKKMAATVFMENEVGEYFDENLIALKVNVERGDGPAIRDKYNIQGLPGYVFIDGDGHVVYRTQGSMPTERFMEEVILAVDYAKDPNSVGRLAEHYEEKKTDEAYLKLYLDKLHQSKSTDYTDVLEQFLKVQTSIQEDDKEMVLLLAEHYEQIILGGKADEIINRNIKTDAWKLYVRKDIREVYQKLVRQKLITTTNYAATKKDTAILERTFPYAESLGLPETPEQRNRTYLQYYLLSEQGEEYKQLFRPVVEDFVASMDTLDLRNTYLAIMKRKEDGDPEAARLTPYSVRKSSILQSYISSYAGFANRPQDGADIIRWARIANYILPNDANAMNTYANALYLFGSETQKAEALTLKEKSIDLGEQSGNKNIKGMQLDLALMKEGKTYRFK